MNEQRYSEEIRRYLLWRYAVPELRLLAARSATIKI